MGKQLIFIETIIVFRLTKIAQNQFLLAKNTSKKVGTQSNVEL